jgi:glyoxylase-like metal-dependent hydrolase (beta-lactamase superfamily II)
VVVGDPIGGGPNPNAPQLIKNAIAGVTDKPVRYLVISHDSPDHSTGGAVFADTADIVAQKNAIEKFRQRNDPRSPVPNVVVDDRMSIDLGGKHLEVAVPGGRNHTDNMVVLYYPARKILFAVDYVPIRRLPFRTLAGDYPDEWVRTLNWTEQVDFDVLVPGHGPLGSKENVRQVRDYFADLFQAIRGARVLGNGDASTYMTDYVRGQLGAKYGRWENFDAWLPENIQGVTKYWTANNIK